MKRSIILSIALLLSGATLFAVAQDAELSLYTKITDAIKKHEPEWKLNRKAIMPNQVIIRWTSNKGRALVSVALLTSEAEAKQALKSRVDELEDIPESKVSKTKLNEFGDEGYILRNDGVSGVNIIFRKSVYVAQVFGPSEDVARRFSQHISDLLPTSNNSFNRSAD
ncbi:MAG: hypothetical protein AUG51_02090 [Acidobacteria bacterium 13_1_20CM_3_53_8]|nr:MAG: hypothetical protein AUG51_02090 [Acidobacteria bacterium 13_1_20CM_3_53_8]